jgi:hypothetical protein
LLISRNLPHCVYDRSKLSYSSTNHGGDASTYYKYKKQIDFFHNVRKWQNTKCLVTQHEIREIYIACRFSQARGSYIHKYNTKNWKKMKM